MWWIISFIVLSVVALGVTLYNAPEGYEDEDGFHYGPDPFNDEHDW